MSARGKARGPSSIVRMATWSATHPWRAVAAWLLFVVACVVVGGVVVGGKAATGVDYRVGEAGRAEALAARGGQTVPAVERVLVTARGGRFDVADGLAAGRDVAQRFAAVPQVDQVERPRLSGDRSAVLVVATLRGDQIRARDALPALDRATAAARTEHPSLRLDRTGSASVGRGNDVQRGQDLALSEAITLPLTLVILLVVFGAVLAAGVPVLLAVSSIAAATGLAALFSHLVPDAGVGAQIIVLMGMAFGVDYSLFYLRRVREERDRSGGRVDHTTAVRLAAATSGHAVVVSGVGVIVSTACLFVARDVIFASIATATITVVAVAVISSLTVLPAVLALLGPRIDRPRVPFAGRRLGRTADPRAGRVWRTLLRPATTRPVATLVVAVLAVLALATPALGLKLNEPGDSTFSREIPAVVVGDRVNALFPDQTAAHLVVVRSDVASAGAVRSAVAELGARAAHDPAMGGHVRPEVRTTGHGTTTTVRLHLPYEATTPAAQRSLHELRDRLLPSTVGRVSGATYAVSGDVARNADYVDHQTAVTPLVIGLVLLMTFVMMLVAFRSVVLGAIAVALNLLSAAGAFGVLTLVFQGRWAAGLLDFVPAGFVSARVPLFLFVMLFGLSMDYQVFVVSRIREAVVGGRPVREAVREGITSSAGVVTSAAVVMVSVFASFVFLHLLEVKQMGVGLAVAVLLDAAVVRVLILPALLTLLGRAAWWPSRLSRPVRARAGSRSDVGAVEVQV